MASKLNWILILLSVAFITCQLVMYLLTKTTLFKSITLRDQSDRTYSVLTINRSDQTIHSDYVKLRNDSIQGARDKHHFNDPMKLYNPGHIQLIHDSIPGAEEKYPFNDPTRHLKPGHAQLNNDSNPGAPGTEGKYHLNDTKIFNKQGHVQPHNDSIPGSQGVDDRHYLNDRKFHFNPGYVKSNNDSIQGYPVVDDRRHLNDTNKHCNRRRFQLNNDGICHPILTCMDIKDNVTIMRHVNSGGLKDIYLARWKDYVVSLVRLRSVNQGYLFWQQVFLSGVKMVLKFQPSPFVIKILGYCPSIPAMITEYHPFGSLDNINKMLTKTHMDNVTTRFRLCLDYVRILNFLHTHPTGTHVMCDSNRLRNTLSQFLVTSDFHVVVNDLDRLPVVDSANGKLTDCSIKVHKEFSAPEQFFTDRKGHQRGYDEKTDIWKIPPVVDYLLSKGARTNSFDQYRIRTVKSHLSKIHQRCRRMDPRNRPTAAEVLKEYLNVQDIMTL